ncbi:MAG: PD-(D/E)XK nuclease family protein, partial [Candidatus Adiutrix sp.]
PLDASFHELFNELMQLIEKECREHEGKSPVGRAPLWPLRTRRLKALISTWLKGEIDRGSRSTPLYLEWEFGAGKNTQSPPLKIELFDGQTIYLKGRIDRIDETDEGAGFLVHDYKLRYFAAYKINKQTLVIPPLLYPLHVYALGVFSFFKKQTACVVDFLNPRDNEATLWGLDSTQTQLSLNINSRKKSQESGEFNLPNQLGAIWGEITRGVFNPDWSGESPDCTYCQFTLICPRADCETV